MDRARFAAIYCRPKLPTITLDSVMIESTAKQRRKMLQLWADYVHWD
jgi:hypothetical protein